MTPNELKPEVRELLRAVFDAYSDADEFDHNYQARLEDFVFHMGDWWEDFSKFGWSMLHPGSPPNPQAVKAVYGFLVHALPHLMAASETLHGEPASHPFEVLPVHEERDTDVRTPNGPPVPQVN